MRIAAFYLTLVAALGWLTPVVARAQSTSDTAAMTVSVRFVRARPAVARVIRWLEHEGQAERPDHRWPSLHGWDGDHGDDPARRRRWKSQGAGAPHAGQAVDATAPCAVLSPSAWAGGTDGSIGVILPDVPLNHVAAGYTVPGSRPERMDRIDRAAMQGCLHVHGFANPDARMVAAGGPDGRTVYLVTAVIE